MMQGNCAVCGTLFKAKRPTQRFCSSKCFGVTLNTSVHKTCPICGIEFDVVVGRCKPGLTNCCSVQCAGALQRRLRPLEERFWDKVNKDGPVPPKQPELGQCWIWTGTQPGFGYGFFTGEDRKPIPAHRMSWILEHGSIPEGLHVLHKCDNPPCMRPSHLFVGTQKDNSGDCVAKGRIARGEAHGMAKITEAKVLELRRRFAAGEPLQQLYADSPLSHEATRACIDGRNWAHLTTGIPSPQTEPAIVELHKPSAHAP